jgi:dTDP-4-dehydrorhamnose 3,5-epimerase
MNLEVQTLAIPGVLLFTPRVFGDARGFFLQTYQTAEYAAAGLSAAFVQDNLSRSRAGTLRGLHYQLRHPQGKLVSVLRGAVLDVAVDIRRGSPTFGRWVSALLTEENRRQLFVPPGFAHGFRVMSETADFTYKCTDLYAPGDEYGIRWDDPDVAVDWGLPAPDPSAMFFSDKDMRLPLLADIPPENLPLYTPA